MPVVSLLFHDVFVAAPRESGFASAAADRYKLSLPDFEKQLDGLDGLGDFRLTFDDGGVSFSTLVADRLEARGWRGFVFMTTDFIGTAGFLDAAQLRELDARGHIIGSHSASHPTRCSVLTRDQMRREWAESRAILEDILGHAVTAASVPGGYFSRRVAQAAADAGLQTLFTSEPTTASGEERGCRIHGRFTIRRGHPNDMARRFVEPAPWARCAAWTTWNAKGLVKPLLGSSYMRVADWVLRSPQSSEHA